MLNMNRATLVGHAGRDPETRELKKGGRAAVFTLATTEKWTDVEGRPGEATEWHRIVVYGPTVETVGKMLRKGDRAMVEGRIATRAFTDREGNDRAVTEIVVSGRQGLVNILTARRARPDRGEPVPAPESGPGQASEPGGQAEETPDADAGGGAPESPA